MYENKQGHGWIILLQAYFKTITQAWLVTWRNSYQSYKNAFLSLLYAGIFQEKKGEKSSKEMFSIVY
jgi:hypothetical protein